MPVIKIKKNSLPKAQFGPPFSFGQGLVQAVQQIQQNAPQEDVKAGRMADQPYYNPFDLKWGQQQEPQVDITGSQSNKPLDQYATSATTSTSASKGSLNLPQLVNTNLLTQDQKKTKKPFNFANFASGLGKASGWAGVGLGIAGAAADYFSDRRKQKDWDKWFREQNLPDNMYAASPGDRGDFDINEGIYKPNQLTPPNVGAAMAQYGGTQYSEDMNLVKIRLRPAQEMMKYGGQLGFGLDIGQRRVYTEMPKGKDEQASNTLNPVPREQANIEAEKGETAYGDLDGDGALEHFNIGGKRHVDGGTPLNVPEGSFIFSDTKKMIIKDPSILEKFGMSPRKEGYTPAEIAKKYDINKYKGIMEDPNADYVRKNTAQIMIKSFQKKLAELALIQESMKGFPAGIPQIAKDTHPELAERYAKEYGIEEEALEDEANQQEQVMERGMTEPEEEMEGEEEYAMDEQSTMPEEQMMGEEMPQARWGGSRLPSYQGATTGSTVYNNSNWGSVNPMFNTNPPQQTTPTSSAPVYTQTELQKMYPWYKPYTESKTVAGRTTPTKKSSLFDPNIPSQYNDVDYWVKDAAAKGIKINDTESLQRHIYNTLEKEDPSAVQEMWKEFGHTAKGTDLNVENFADTMAGARSAFLGGKRIDKTVTGFICTGRDASGQPQIQQSSYMSAEARQAAGAAATQAEAATQCPEVPQKGVPPGRLNVNAARKKVPTGWMTPDIVNMAAAAAVAPKKYLPYAAPVQFEPGRVSLEDWRAQAAARQSMYNKQGELMGVYGPTTGQAAAQSSAAGQQAEGLTGDIAGVTSRNVDRFNQFMQGERQRKDQFNMLGANRATELFKGNVIANQQYDNARRQYLNNIAKTFGQGWKNASQLGMLNAVNPMFQVDPFSGRSYFTNRGKGFDRFSRSTGQSMATSFPALKNQYMAMGMKEDNAEKLALKQLTNPKNFTNSPGSDYLSEYGSLFR